MCKQRACSGGAPGKRCATSLYIIGIIVVRDNVIPVRYHKRLYPTDRFAYCRETKLQAPLSLRFVCAPRGGWGGGCVWGRVREINTIDRFATSWTASKTATLSKTEYFFYFNVNVQGAIHVHSVTWKHTVWPFDWYSSCRTRPGCKKNTFLKADTQNSQTSVCFHPNTQ